MYNSLIISWTAWLKKEPSEWTDSLKRTAWKREDYRAVFDYCLHEYDNTWHYTAAMESLTFVGKVWSFLKIHYLNELNQKSRCHMSVRVKLCYILTHSQAEDGVRLHVVASLHLVLVLTQKSKSTHTHTLFIWLLQSLYDTEPNQSNPQFTTFQHFNSILKSKVLFAKL